MSIAVRLKLEKTCSDVEKVYVRCARLVLVYKHYLTTRYVYLMDEERDI